MISVTEFLSPQELEATGKRMILIRGFTNLDMNALYENFEHIHSFISMFPNFKHDGSFSGSVSVILDSEGSCREMIEKLNNTTLCGSIVTCEKYSSQFKDTIQLNLHIRNVPKEWTTEELTNYCSHFGEIQSCIRVQKKEDLVHGFVSYKDREGYIKALQSNEANVVFLFLFNLALKQPSI